MTTTFHATVFAAHADPRPLAELFAGWVKGKDAKGLTTYTSADGRFVIAATGGRGGFARWCVEADGKRLL